MPQRATGHPVRPDSQQLTRWVARCFGMQCPFAAAGWPALREATALAQGSLMASQVPPWGNRTEPARPAPTIPVHGNACGRGRARYASGMPCSCPRLLTRGRPGSRAWL